MSLVAIDGTPLVPVGVPYVTNNLSLPSATSILQDAAKEACIMYGYIITDDGASHTIDTTGSSSMGWRAGTVSATWNASTAFKVGLTTVLAGTPARAANTTDAIDFSVSKSYTGGTAPTSASWIENVPDAGTMTIANGDLVAFATQMTAQGATDSANTQVGSTNVGYSLPAVVSYTGGSYAASAAVPSCVITFSDGHLGWFFGGAVFSTPSTLQTWNSGSGTKEYGNYILLPFPTKVYGIVWNFGSSAAGACDMVLYSDALGTPVAQKTVSVAPNTVSGTGRYGICLFPAPYTTTASQPLAAIMKPTSGTNVAAVYKTFNASAHQVTETGGTNCYAVNRASGAFAAQNSNKDRFQIGILIGAFDGAVSAGGGIRQAGRGGLAAGA